MNDTIIKVSNLGKRYVISHKNGRSEGLRHAIQDLVTTPLRWLKEKGRNGKQNHENGASQNGHQHFEPPASTLPASEEFWALRDVSFEVKRGEVVGIIGRNGAGKSTLLKVLSRITEPSTGRVEIDGRVASLLEVGTGFHPELTGRENIFLNGAILGMSRTEIRKKFDEIVAFAEVEKFLDIPVKRYSSGMYVRLAFAVAAHLEPEILIVDEVLAVGDAQFQKKCLGKMQDVASGGRTVLFVSHNMAAIQQLCNRAVLLRSGSIAKDGQCPEVALDYLADATASSNGYADLSTHPARSQSCKPVITEILMRNSGGEPTSSVFPQEKIAIEITIQSKEQIKQPRAALAIEDSFGRRLMTMASYFNQAELPHLQNKSILRCECNSLLLGPGRYLLSVSIATKKNGLIDSVDGAFWFETVWDNNYKNGEPYYSTYGPLLKESNWSLKL
jgi:lipopolysaccharide transport system ATP-binding protein